MRIDAHVHAFPERLALAVRSALNERGGLTAGPLLEQVATRVREEGFDRAWVLPYAHRPGIAEAANAWSAHDVMRYPWLDAGATFHPGDEDLPRLVHEALVENGLRVVKLHCSVGQFSPADARLVPLWEVAASGRIPVVVHAGQLSPGDTGPDEIDQLIPVLKAYPALPLVLAHTGNPNWQPAVQLMADYENLYGDLTPVWDRPTNIPFTDMLRFPGRFLFGSDAPNNPTPARDQAAKWESTLSDPDLREAVMGGTAARLVPPPQR